MAKLASDNSTSRQRMVRVPDNIDDWLKDRSRKAKASDPESRAGVATEINAILKAAYEADQKPTRRKA